MREKGKKMLNFLVKDFEQNPSRRGLGKRMSNDIEECYKALDGKFSEKELERLSACYQAAANDSANSASLVVATNSLHITALSCIVAILAVMVTLYLGLNPQEGERGIYIFFTVAMSLFIVFIVILILSNKNKILLIESESAKFRNNIIAINLILAEMNEMKEEVAKDEKK